MKRLDSEGKPLDLAGPNLANGQPFNAASTEGQGRGGVLLGELEPVAAGRREEAQCAG